MSTIEIILIVVTIVIIINIIIHYYKLKDQGMNTSLLEGELEGARHAYMALQEEFSNYQVETDRKIVELEKQLEIKSSNAERRMDRMNKSLPSVIRNVVGHIEFAKPLDKK